MGIRSSVRWRRRARWAFLIAVLLCFVAAWILSESQPRSWISLGNGWASSYGSLSYHARFRSVEQLNGIDFDHFGIRVQRWPSLGGFTAEPGFAYAKSVRVHYAVPTTLVAVTLLLDLLVALFRNRSRAGRCPACGYDLRATPEFCPECGHSVKIATEAGSSAP
jgi:hypothetical protein